MLKDILLVMASLSIFGDPVTPLQMFGYSIALGGLMWYKLGGDKLREMSTQSRLAIGQFRNERPGATRLVVGCAVFAVVALGLWVWYPVVPEGMKGVTGV